MFERYTERARRVIFFSRYEASQRSSAYIELEDVVLGALREDPLLKTALSPETIRELSEELRATKPTVPYPSQTSVDLPLSKEARVALAYGAEEAERQQKEHISAGHLVLGVLRFADSAAVGALNRRGIELEGFRELVANANPRDELRPLRVAPRLPKVVSPSLAPIVSSLFASVSIPLLAIQVSRDGFILGEESWTRKQALGHLVDLAMANQQWIAGALAHGELHATNIPDKSWVDVQKYADDNWNDMVDLWLHVNRHLLNVIAGISEDKLSLPCRIAGSEPVPLQAILSGYAGAVSEWIRRITSNSDSQA